MLLGLQVDQRPGMTHRDQFFADGQLYFDRKFKQPEVIGYGRAFFAYSFAERVLRQVTLVDQPLKAQRDFDRIEVLPLNVLDDGHREHGFLVRLADIGRHRSQSGQLRGAPAALSADDRISSVRFLTHGDRLNDAERADRLGQLVQSLFAEMGARLFGIRGDPVDLDHLESAALRFLGQCRAFYFKNCAQTTAQAFGFRVHGGVPLFFSVFLDEFFGQIQVVDAARRGCVVQ